MDTFVLISVIFGILKISQGYEAGTLLRCIECEHIGWNNTYRFPGAQNIYQLLQSKYNPACAAVNPRDPNVYNQNYQNQLNQQMQLQNTNPQQQGSNFFQNRNEVRETVCPALQNTVDRCNYVYGIATVELPVYGATMTLAMHARNCIDIVNTVDNGCYHRDTNLGYHEVKTFIQNKLQFLGSAELKRFVGTQCYCHTDMCYPYINSSRNVVASGFSLILALITFIVIR
ncbi:uncharacterized protein LOC123527711 [Mercenaria mercenaria]|uniref:uncharacterized protein LOC123527711 n=1 Tax=Mercenaria mercenaria TaxID=6596 RepID=UPI00234F33B9|nr:uncharacterized protein LOC123527711 [Mercenaria mercenaria]